MSESLDKLIADLRNRNAGWVTRRDAAEGLGRVAAKALHVLHEHADEDDVDVQRSVRKGLGYASAGLRGVGPTPADRAYTLEELAEGCASEGRREVARHQDGYRVRVQLKDDRVQDVFITPFERQDGEGLVRVYTRCGAYDEDSLRWCLRSNMKLSHGALALVEHDGTEEFALTNCFLADEATPEAVKASVKELAFYGDWIENKLTGQDEF